MKSDGTRAEQIAGEIGRLLRDRRKELGITQTELAGRVGVSQQQIVKYEKGIGRIPAEKLLSLAEPLKIDPGALFHPLAVSDEATRGGFAESDGAGSGFADGGTPYHAETGADRDASKLLRDFQRIDSQAARRAVLDMVSVLAAKEESTSPRRKRR